MYYVSSDVHTLRHCHLEFSCNILILSKNKCHPGIEFEKCLFQIRVVWYILRLCTLIITQMRQVQSGFHYEAQNRNRKLNCTKIIFGI